MIQTYKHFIKLLSMKVIKVRIFQITKCVLKCRLVSVDHVHQEIAKVRFLKMHRSLQGILREGTAAPDIETGTNSFLTGIAVLSC